MLLPPGCQPKDSLIFEGVWGRWHRRGEKARQACECRMIIVGVEALGAGQGGKQPHGWKHPRPTKLITGFCRPENERFRQVADYGPRVLTSQADDAGLGKSPSMPRAGPGPESVATRLDPCSFPTRIGSMAVRAAEEMTLLVQRMTDSGVVLEGLARSNCAQCGYPHISSHPF